MVRPVAGQQSEVAGQLPELQEKKGEQENETIQSLYQQVSDVIKNEKMAWSGGKTIFQKLLVRYWKRKELKCALREIDHKIAALSNHLMGHEEELKNETVALINNLHHDYEQLSSLNLAPPSLLSVPLQHLETIEQHVRKTLHKKLLELLEEVEEFCGPLKKEREEAEEILEAFETTGEIDGEFFAKINVLKKKYQESFEKAEKFHNDLKKLGELDQKKYELETAMNEALGILERIENSVIAVLNDTLLEDVNVFCGPLNVIKRRQGPLETRVNKEREDAEEILMTFQNTGQIDDINTEKINTLREKNEETRKTANELMKKLANPTLKSNNEELEKEKLEFRKELGRCLDASLYTSILTETLYVKNIIKQLEDSLKTKRDDAQTHDQRNQQAQGRAKLEKELKEGLNKLDEAMRTIIIEEETEINAQHEITKLHEKKEILDHQFLYLRLKDDLDERLKKARRQHNLKDRFQDTLDFSTSRLGEYRELHEQISEKKQKSSIPEEWAPLLQEIDEEIESLKKSIFEVKLRRHVLGYEDVDNQKGSERDRLDDIAGRHLKAIRKDVEETLSSFSEYIETLKDQAKQKELREFFYEQRDIAREHICQLGNSMVGAYLLLLEEDKDVISNERQNDEKKIMELYEVLNEEQKKNLLERLKMLPIFSKTKMINEESIKEDIANGRQLDRITKDLSTVWEEMEATLADFSNSIDTIENVAKQEQMREYLRQRGDIAREQICQLGNNSIVDAYLKKIERDYEKAFNEEEALTEEFLQNLTGEREKDEKRIEELHQVLLKISQGIHDDKMKKNRLANLQNFPYLTVLKICLIGGTKRIELQKTLSELEEEQNKWVSSKNKVNKLKDKAKNEAKSIERMIHILIATMKQIPPHKGNIEENKDLIESISNTIGELALLQDEAKAILS